MMEQKIISGSRESIKGDAGESDLRFINQHADKLNAEAEEALDYQKDIFGKTAVGQTCQQAKDAGMKPSDVGTETAEPTLRRGGG